ncbi:MAG: hypothetical protein WC496_01670 [Phycisphaerae bacterium]|jgi:hypothetical protein
MQNKIKTLIIIVIVAIFVNAAVKSASGDITMLRYDDYVAATNFSDGNNFHGSVSFPNDVIWRYYRQLNEGDVIDPLYDSNIMEPDLSELSALPWITDYYDPNYNDKFFWELPTLRYSKFYAGGDYLWQSMSTGGGQLSDKWNSVWAVYTHNWETPGEYDISGKVYGYVQTGGDRYLNYLVGKIDVNSTISTLWTGSTLIYNGQFEVLADLSTKSELQNIVLQKGENLFFAARYDADNGGGHPTCYGKHGTYDYNGPGDSVTLTMTPLDPVLHEGYDIYEHFNTLEGQTPDPNLWYVYKSDINDVVETDGFSRLIIHGMTGGGDKPVGIYGQQPIIPDSDGNCVIECRFSTENSYSYFYIEVSPAPVRGEYSGHPPIYMGFKIELYDDETMSFKGYYNGNTAWEDSNQPPNGTFESFNWNKVKLVLNTIAHTIRGYVYDDNNDLIWETPVNNYASSAGRWLNSSAYYVNIYNVAMSSDITVYLDYVTGSHSVFCGGRDHTYPQGDVNHDCKVDYGDVAEMAEQWYCNSLE